MKSDLNDKIISIVTERSSYGDRVHIAAEITKELGAGWQDPRGRRTIETAVAVERIRKAYADQVRRAELAKGKDEEKARMAAVRAWQSVREHATKIDEKAKRESAGEAIEGRAKTAKTIETYYLEAASVEYARGLLYLIERYGSGQPTPASMIAAIEAFRGIVLAFGGESAAEAVETNPARRLRA